MLPKDFELKVYIKLILPRILLLICEKKMSFISMNAYKRIRNPIWDTTRTEQLLFVCVAKEHVVAHYWIKRYVLAPSYPAEETNYAYVLWVTTQSLGQ